MAEHMHDEDLVQLVVDALNAHARRARRVGQDPYSWGVRRLAMLSSDDTAVAVLDALAESGRLATVRRLRQFGIRFLTLGIAVGGSLVLVAAFTQWPLLATLACGIVAGVAGSRLVNRAAAREVSGTRRRQARG